MQISVIIPTYKHRDFVLQTLDSVFAQTFTDYEVIVVNDGSPDDTAEVLRPLVEAGKIRYIEQSNAGQAAARNRGLAEARGEFIAFLDDDDIWPRDKLDWQVAVLRKQPEIGVVSGSLQLIDAQGSYLDEEEYRKELYTKPLSFESLFYGNPITSPGQTLIRASSLRDVGGFDETLWGVDDYDLWFRLSLTVNFILLPQLGLYYRLHPGNASKDFSRMYKNNTRLFRIQIRRAPVTQRTRLTRVVHQQSYLWIGAQAISVFHVNKLKQSPSMALHNLWHFSRYWWPALRDPKLTKMMIYDIIPRSLKFRKQQNK